MCGIKLEYSNDRSKNNAAQRDAIEAESFWKKNLCHAGMPAMRRNSVQKILVGWTIEQYHPDMKGEILSKSSR